MRWDCSRREKYNERLEVPPEPEIEYGGYLIKALFEVGPFIHGQMGGEMPLSWAEIEAYANLTGEIEEAWEARLLIALSQQYIMGKKEGAKVLSISPLEQLEMEFD